MITQTKQKKECHTSFDICKMIILTKYFSKKKLSLSARLVLWCLVVHWNHRTGEAYPKQITIVKETGLTKMSVIKAIEELRNQKIILTLKTNGRLKYQLTNVFLSLLNESEETTVDGKNNLPNGKQNTTQEGIKILPYIETNNFKKNKEQNFFHQGLRGTNPVKPLLEQYERDKQTAVSPFDDFDCAIAMLKQILKPETQRHAFAKKMFNDIQAVWHLDDSVIQKIKEQATNGKCGTING